MAVTQTNVFFGHVFGRGVATGGFIAAGASLDDATHPTDQAIDTTLSVIGYVGAAADVLKTLGESAELALQRTRDARDAADTLYDVALAGVQIGSRAKLYPPTKTIAKVLERSSETLLEIAEKANRNFERFDERAKRIEPYVEKYQKYEDKLDLVGNIGLGADALQLALGISRTALNNALDDVQIAESAYARDLTGFAEVDEGMARVALPDSVGDKLTDAFDALNARARSRVELVERATAAVNTVKNFVAEITPDGPDALFDHIEGLSQRLQQLINGAGLDLFEDLRPIIKSVGGVTSIFNIVLDAIQPILDLFGPVISLIEGIIETIEKAIGLDRVEQLIQDQIDALIQPLVDPLLQFVEDLFNAIPTALFEALDFVFAQYVEFTRILDDLFADPILQVAEQGDLPLLDDEAIVVGLDAAETIRPAIDPEFADGYGGWVFAGGGNDTVEGTPLVDLLLGGAGDDTIDARGGADLVLAGEGDDQVFGGAGDDQLLGEAGDDLVDGGAGDDEVFGGDGADSLFGGDGDDSLEGGDGADTLTAGDGADTVNGGEGNDLLIADSGVGNVLDGEGGLDTIRTLGAASATHLILDPTAVLRGGDGLDVISIGDAYAAGVAIPADVFFDAGAAPGLARDRLETGSLDLDAFAPRVENVETYRLVTVAGSTVTLTTRADSLAEFQRFEIAGDGAAVIDVTDGDFLLDALPGGTLTDLGALATVDNPQDPPGTDDNAPVAPLTIRLHDGGAAARGLANYGAGITVLGGIGDDTIVGGGGSDVLRGGLGTDLLDGARGDGGNRFDIVDGAVGDVYRGTEAELDGDTIRNFSNRVDRLRVEASEATIAATVAAFESDTPPVRFEDGDTLVTVGTAEIRIEGSFPKLIARANAAEGYVEILNNNVPPTAVDDEIRTSYQLEGEDAVAIDPLGNDFDADTPADEAAGVVRREIAVTESLSVLLRLVEPNPADPPQPGGLPTDDALREAFAAGEVPEPLIGTSFETELGNRIVFTAEGLFYEAPQPTLQLRRLAEGDAGVEVTGGEAVGLYNNTTDLPFFGLDRILYRVYDREGEVSNLAAVDILIGPYAPDDTAAVPALPTITVLGEDGDAVEVTLGTGGATDRLSLTAVDSATESMFLNADLGTAVSANDYIRVEAASGSFGGRSGNDVIDARFATGGVGLFGGSGADWLEGGAFDDFLTGGGLNDEYLPEIDLDGDGEPDGSFLPNFLLGGAGDNVFAASIDYPGGGLPPDLTEPRQTIYVLDGGAEVITGPVSNAAGTLVDLAAINSAGPTAVAASALDGDRVIGFDGDDSLIVPVEVGTRIGTVNYGNLTYDIDLPRFTLDSEVVVTRKGPVSTGVIVTDADLDDRIGSSYSIVPGIFDDTTFDAQFIYARSDTVGAGLGFGLFVGDFSINGDLAGSFNAWPQIISYDIDAVPASGTGADVTDGGRAPSTLLSVSLEGYRWETGIANGGSDLTDRHEGALGTNSFTVTQTLVPTGVLRADEAYLDPMGSSAGDGVHFTVELDGAFDSDRFYVALVRIDDGPTAPFVDIIEYGLPTLATSADSGGRPYQFLSRPATEALAANSDDQLGLAIRYRALEVEDDALVLRRGDSATIDVFANDANGDGNGITLFDLAFDSEADRARLTDGGLANGEVLVLTDLNTGLGTGEITIVAPEEGRADFGFDYIADDNGVRSTARIQVDVRGLPPELGDDVIVLPADSDGRILFGTVLDNDADPDGDPLALETLSLNGIPVDILSQQFFDPMNPFSLPEGIGLDVVPFEGTLPPGPGFLLKNLLPSAQLPTPMVFVRGFDLGNEVLQVGGAAPIGADGTGGQRYMFDYGLSDPQGDGSDFATVEVAVAAPLTLASPGALTLAEDGVLSVDLLGGRAGGFGEIVDVGVTGGTVVGAAGAALDTAFFQVADGALVFTPPADLFGLTFSFTATITDVLGSTASADFTVALTPVEDAPELAGADRGDRAPIAAVEDTPLPGTLQFGDVDALDPALIGPAAALAALAENPEAPFEALDPATLALIADLLPVPDGTEPIETEAGGSLLLTAGSAPGTADYVYTRPRTMSAPTRRSSRLWAAARCRCASRWRPSTTRRPTRAGWARTPASSPSTPRPSTPSAPAISPTWTIRSTSPPSGWRLRPTPRWWMPRSRRCPTRTTRTKPSSP